jgi:hypothetical protein
MLHFVLYTFPILTTTSRLYNTNIPSQFYSYFYTTLNTSSFYHESYVQIMDKQRIIHIYKKKANPAATTPISPLMPWIEILAPASLAASVDVTAALELVAEVPFPAVSGDVTVLTVVGATRIPVLVTEIATGTLVCTDEAAAELLKGMASLDEV